MLTFLQMRPYLYLALSLACGVAFIMRFRGSLGAVFGGVSFGLLTVGPVTYFVFTASEISFGDYPVVQILVSLSSLVAFACLIPAFLTARVHSRFQDHPTEAVMPPIGGRGPMPILEVLFSFRGRISRSEYWLKAFPILLPFNILLCGVYLSGREFNDILAFAVILNMIYLWPLLAVLLKRWHDRDRSAWWLLTLLIPFVNFLASIWISLEVWFFKGTDGPNRFGPDPLQACEEVEQASVPDFASSDEDIGTST